MRRTAATTAAECNGTPTVDFKEKAGAAAAQTKAVNSVPVSNARPFIAQHVNWLTDLEKKSREPRIFYWITTCLLSCTVLGTPYFWLSSFGSTGKEICVPSTYASSTAFGLDFFSPAAGTQPGATCGEPAFRRRPRPLRGAEPAGWAAPGLRPGALLVTVSRCPMCGKQSVGKPCQGRGTQCRVLESKYYCSIELL